MDPKNIVLKYEARRMVNGMVQRVVNSHNRIAAAKRVAATYLAKVNETQTGAS